MAGNNNRKNAAKEAFYVLAVLVLIAALGGLYFLHLQQDKRQEEVLETIIANEQSPEINNAKLLSDAMEDEKPAEEADNREQDVPTEATADQKTEAVADPQAQAGSAPAAASESQNVQQTSASPAAAGNGEWEAAMPVNGTAQSAETAQNTAGQAQEQIVIVDDNAQQTAQAQTAENTAAGLQNSSVMILNGTYKNGVASYWQGKLKDAGYNNLFTASYSGKAEQTTYIYTKNTEQAQALKEFFPNAEIREGDLPSAYTMSDGVAKPDSCDYYIVVGIADGVNQ